MNEWPQLAAVPSLLIATEIASEIRRYSLGLENAESNPCDINRLCQLGGFRVKRLSLVESPKDHQALLVPRIDGGFDILVDPSVAHIGGVETGASVSEIEFHRFRYRIAHEIGHSFFFDRKSRPPIRLIESSKAEEEFCDRFASALLVPPNIVRNMPISAQTIFELRRRYNVSAEVAGRCFARVWPELTVIGLLWRKNPKNGVGGMRVVWSAGPKFVPLRARLNSSVVDEAYQNSKSCGVERLGVGTLRGLFKVDAARPRRGNQVVAIAKQISS